MKRALVSVSGGELVEPNGLSAMRGFDPLGQKAKNPHMAGFLLSGGERGIRTLDGLFEPILP
jgi:hypothetical protein